MSAPNRLSSPATIQTAKRSFTEPTKWIMVEGTRNTPLPITVPMTIEMALHKPRTRCKEGPSTGLVLTCIYLTGRARRPAQPEGPPHKKSTDIEKLRHKFT